ncbi:MAG: glycosyl hydrolase family protein, partial [Rhizobiaceae bacterium]
MYMNFLNVAVATPGAVQNYFNNRPGAGVTANGTARNDQMTDGAVRNTLIGGAGDDQYMVAFDGTTIIEAAGGGLDAVTAYNNFALPANVEIGRVQADLVTIVAAPTGSLLQAYGSRDVLVGGRGNDILVDESKGKQTLFEIGDGSGKDVIYKFTAKGADHDLIRLNDPQFTSFSAVKAAMTQVDKDVLIDLSANDKLLIKDVKISDLTDDDFLLRFSPSGLKMTFQDEFNGLSLYSDTNPRGTWDTTFRYGPDNSLSARTLPGNGEDQVYTDPKFGPNPFSVSDGELSITAEKLTAAESAKLWNYKYASGLLTTEHSFAQTYGYFEIKAELPVEQGMFPAFWLMPKAAVWPPEIDIMENVGENWVSGGAIAPNDHDAFRTFFPEG